MEHSSVARGKGGGAPGATFRGRQSDITKKKKKTDDRPTDHFLYHAESIGMQCRIKKWIFRPLKQQKPESFKSGGVIFFIATLAIQWVSIFFCLATLAIAVVYTIFKLVALILGPETISLGCVFLRRAPGPHPLWLRGKPLAV